MTNDTTVTRILNHTDKKGGLVITTKQGKTVESPVKGMVIFIPDMSKKNLTKVSQFLKAVALTLKGVSVSKAVKEAKRKGGK